MDKSNTSSKNKILVAIGGLVVLLIAAIVAIIVLLMQNNRLESITPKVPNAAGVVLSGSTRSNTLNTLDSAMQELREKSVIMSIEDASGYSTVMLYNSHNEAVAEDPSYGSRTIHLNYNHTIYFGETIAYGQDSDVLGLMGRAIEMAQADSSIPVLNSVNDLDLTETDENGNLTQSRYFIDIVGWDKLSEFYSYVSDEFSAAMVDNLKSQLVDTTEDDDTDETSETTDTDVESTDSAESIPVGFRIYYIVNSDNTLDHGGCLVYFTDKPSDEVTWNELEVSWEFYDYIELTDWQLSDEWYELDWMSLESWEDLSPAEDLFMELYNQLIDNMNQMAGNDTTESESESESESDVGDTSTGSSTNSAEEGDPAPQEAPPPTDEQTTD